jgi:hypothetical protein
MTTLALCALAPSVGLEPNIDGVKIRHPDHLDEEGVASQPGVEPEFAP